MNPISKETGTAAGLTVRKMKPEDLGPLYELLSDPRVMEHLEAPYSMEQTERFLVRAGLGETPLIYAVERNGAFIGYVIYHDFDEDSIEIGWVMNPGHWGKGYASSLTGLMIGEAERAGKDLIIECSPEQAVTKHIALKYGFESAGTADGTEIYRRR